MFNPSDDPWPYEDEITLPRLPTPATIMAGLTPAQADAAAHDGPILVLAGAGTGKTRTLTAGVALRIAELGIVPNRILCVTFTNKAAAEMKQRIAAMLMGSPVPSWIGTFHGLGARQLRAEPEIGGLRCTAARASSSATSSCRLGSRGCSRPITATRTRNGGWRTWRSPGGCAGSRSRMSSSGVVTRCPRAFLPTSLRRTVATVG